MKLYFDMETIPDQGLDALDQILDTIEPPGNIKKPESIDKWMMDKAPAAAAEKLAKTGLDGLRGEICAIGFAFDDQPAVSLVRTHDESELDLLLRFGSAVADQCVGGRGEHPHLEWIGHNVIEFDLRFLKQRCFVNKVNLGVYIPADARHGNRVFDTMKEWCGWKGYVKQDELCKAFGLPTKPGMTGAGVGNYWADGRFDEIREYNLYDVDTVRAIHQIMTGKF